MPPTSIIGPPFLVRGAQEGIGHALVFEGSLKDAPPAVRRDFYLVLEALGGAHQEHQEHLRSAQGRFWRRLSTSLKSKDLKRSITSPKTEKRSPNSVDDARVWRARRTPTSYAQWRTCFSRFNVRKPPGCNIPQNLAFQREIRTQVCASCWRTQRARRTAQLGLLLSLFGAVDVSFQIARG